MSRLLLSGDRINLIWALKHFMLLWPCLRYSSVIPSNFFKNLIHTCEIVVNDLYTQLTYHTEKQRHKCDTLPQLLAWDAIAFCRVLGFATFMV